jgi:hypothetical protein
VGTGDNIDYRTGFLREHGFDGAPGAVEGAQDIGVEQGSRCDRVKLVDPCRMEERCVVNQAIDLPKAETQVSISRPASSHWATSATQAITLPPSAAIAAAVSPASMGSMSLITTAAPRRAQPLAQAAPIPLPEPVITCLAFQ